MLYITLCIGDIRTVFSPLCTGHCVAHCVQDTRAVMHCALHSRVVVQCALNTRTVVPCAQFIYSCVVHCAQHTYSCVVHCVLKTDGLIVHCALDTNNVRSTLYVHQGMLHPCCKITILTQACMIDIVLAPILGMVLDLHGSILSRVTASPHDMAHIGRKRKNTTHS